MTNLAYLEWQRGSRTLDAIGAWSTNLVPVGDERPERIRATALTPSLLTLLEAVPLKGRLFLPGDDEPARAPMVLISHGFWQERYGGRADIVGQTIRINAKMHTIVGVMPPTFAFPDSTTRMWITLYVPPVINPSGFSLVMFQAIGRLKPGVTPAQAASEATALARGGPSQPEVALAVFGSTGLDEVIAIPLREALTGDVKLAFLLLRVAVFLLLATATERGEPSTRARHRASSRARDPRRHRCGERPARSAGTHGKRLVRSPRWRCWNRAGCGDASGAAAVSADKFSARDGDCVRRSDSGVCGSGVRARRCRMRPAAGMECRARERGGRAG
jgi:hypothetical protein